MGTIKIKDARQGKLVGGININIPNKKPILGSGDIAISTDGYCISRYGKRPKKCPLNLVPR